MEKTLYVSDLDGTLLKKDETLSPFTIKTINALTDRGMLFSFATARSLVTAKKVTQGLASSVLSVVYNGTFVVNNQTGEFVVSNFFQGETAYFIREVLESQQISPMVYSFQNEVEKFSYHAASAGSAMKDFYESRKGDPRESPVASTEELYRGEVFYFTCIGEEAPLRAAYEILMERQDIGCIYHKDIYTGARWLELMPAGASKAQAVLKLKELYKINRIVSFGDAENDLPMFAVSDECYAMENACDALKKAATAVIGSHEDDSVAKWLHANVRL